MNLDNFESCFLKIEGVILYKNNITYYLSCIYMTTWYLVKSVVWVSNSLINQSDSKVGPSEAPFF
jgi:hypothetical protein